MAALSVFIDLSSVSLLIYENAEDYEFITYPYVYSPNVFSNYISKDAFYGAVLQQLCKQHGVDISACEVYLSGFIEGVNPVVDSTSVKLMGASSLSELLQKIRSYYPILVNTYSIATPTDFLSRVESARVTEKPSQAAAKDEGVDIHANLSIYPQLQNFDLNTQIELDETVLANSGILSVPKDASIPLVFMGSRFCCGHVKELDYILMFSLLRDLGVYELKLDRNNALILTNLIGDDSLDVHEGLESVGTYISVGDSAECMISTLEGSKQLLDLAKDSLHIIPLGGNETADISIKSSSCFLNASVRGGTLGLIFDTRETRGSFYSDVRMFNRAMKVVGEALKSF